MGSAAFAFPPSRSGQGSVQASAGPAIHDERTILCARQRKLVGCTQLAMKNSPALWELAYDDSFFMTLRALAWLPALCFYPLMW